MALTNSKQVEALANSLTACADAMHARLMKAVKAEEIDLAKAQALFQDETILRQRANGLYIDAAQCVVDELSVAQKELMEVIDTANKKMKQIKKISAFIDLTADILMLASAAYAAKPGPIVAALGEIKEDIEHMK